MLIPDIPTKAEIVDEGLFDRNLFRFFCKTKELNSQFLQINWSIFDENIAFIAS